MSIEITFESRCDDDERAEHFQRLTSLIAPNIASIGQQADVPPTEVVVVLTDNFVLTADELLAADAASAGTEHQTFTTERVAGTVAAKNIPMSADGSTIAVVFNADYHHFVAPELQAHSLFLIAHELTHPLLTRLRAASGSMQSLVPPPTELASIARGITVGAIDEYRADLVADLILGKFASATVDGKTRPLRMTELLGGTGHRGNIPDVINDHVYPGWPDLIDDYRSGEFSLMELARKVIVSTDQVFTALGHAEAEAAVAGEENAFNEACSDHRGVVLYLGPAWSQIMEVVDQQSFLPALETFAAREQNVIEVGESAILEMWAKLGLVPEPLATGGDYLHVYEPLR